MRHRCCALTHDMLTKAVAVAGFAPVQDIGLQSNFIGPSGQQGPYGSSGITTILSVLLSLRHARLLPLVVVWSLSSARA